MTLPTILLPTIQSPEDLRRLPETSLEQVADELRSETIGAVAVTGGHLRAGLGVGRVNCRPALRFRHPAGSAGGGRGDLPDLFIDQDSPVAMYAKACLDARGIIAKVFEALGKDLRAADAIQLA
jgi:deoxyxylulose-5-phosphate synthase